MRPGWRGGGCVLLAAALGAACAVPSPSPAAGGAVPRSIEALVNDYHRQGWFDGAVLVAEGDRVVYSGAFGLADREANAPFAASTRLRIGSISKAFIALTVLGLAEEGRIALDSTVSAYLPPSGLPLALSRRITVRQFLTHTSGLPDYNSIPAMFRTVQDSGLSEAEILRRIGRYPLRFEPGTGFGYSNDGYRVLAAVIAGATGRPWEDAVRERVLAPAGMSSSGYASRGLFGPPPAAGFAAGYRRTVDTVAPAPYYRESPASGYYSTVEDLYRFDRALYGDRLASPASKALM